MSLDGRRVVHPKYGPGTVKSKISGAFLLLVDFDKTKGIPLYVRRDECRFLEPDRKVEEVKIRISFPVEESIPCSADIAAACFVETLRLGIVPNNVSEFTFGRDSELDAIANWIEKENSPPLLIVGDYGSGKSHLLQCLRDRYLKLGWVISSFQMNPSECPLHRPKRVYNKITKSIRYLKNEEELDFRSLLSDFAGLKSGILGQNYLDCVLGLCRERHYPSIDYIWDWIEGSGPITYFAGLPLYDDAPSANIYCSILSGIANLAKEAGFKGFLIMLDEAEQLSGSHYVPYQFSKGIDFFAGLSLASFASELLNEEPEWNYNPPPTMIGPRSNLPYSARKPIRYLNSRSSSFKLIFAFSEIEFLRGYLYQRLGSPIVVRLRPLSEKTKSAILHALCETYCQAYAGFAYNDVSQLIGDIMNMKKYSDSVRTLIKVFIEALDIIRYYSIKSHRSFLH